MGKTKGKKSKKSSKRRRSQTVVPPFPSSGLANGAYVNTAVPDSSTLLAYKLLKDSAGAGNNAVFDDMLQNELKYLYGGISLLRNDPKIAGEMGGETMANAATLAQILKAKTKELDFNDRIENIASDILYHDYAKPSKLGLAPGRIPASVLQSDGAGGVAMNFRPSAAVAAHGITVNNLANTPPVAARAVQGQNVVAQQVTDANGNFRQRRGIPIFGAMF